MLSDNAQESAATVRPKVRDLLATGHTPREIALQLGISTQRVYQHMEALKAAAKEAAS